MENKTVAIYGAQGIALGTYEALSAVSPETDIECFIVTSYDNNPKSLAGIPVLELGDYVERYSGNNRLENIKIIIATPEAVMDEIERSLLDNGIVDIERMDSERYSDIWKEYQAKKGDFRPVCSYPIVCDDNTRNDLTIFMARYHKDKPLTRELERQDCFREIQVGASNTSERIKSFWDGREIITDNVGDNISAKNGNYSELTALFWLWKNKVQKAGNDSGSYWGLCHYRRQLDIKPDELNELGMRDIDVVLPFPLPYEPDINAHHKRYLSDADWSAVLAALKELQPDYYHSLDEVFGNGYLYNYNLIIAKGSVLDDYCSWLFPILERVEQLSSPKGSERSDRYIGYIAESLETLYFMKNREKLRIAHAGCIYRM